MDALGVLELLRRRCKRILAIVVVADRDDTLAHLKRSLGVAETERLASFYNPRDPTLGIEYLFDEFRGNGHKHHLHLGIHYWPKEGLEGGNGHLFVVKNRLPSDSRFPVRPLLTEAELRGELSAENQASGYLDMQESQLGGCWCSCCHGLGHIGNLGPKFPHIPNANQLMTPELFSSLCRLGHFMSKRAVMSMCQLKEAGDDQPEASRHGSSSYSVCKLMGRYDTSTRDLLNAEVGRDTYTASIV